MATAKKMKSGHWRVLGSKMVRGERVRKSFTAPTKRQAELQLAEWLACSDALAPSRRRVSEAIKNYIDLKEKTLSASTIASYRFNARHSFREIDDMFIADLTNADIQRWINVLSLDKSPKTIRNLYAQLMAAIRFENPDISFQVSLPKASVPIPTIPGDAEIRLLLERAEPEMRKAIYLAAFGGLRRGEICGLTYGDILPNKNMIHIHRVIVSNSYGEYEIKNIPKNAMSDRYVELPHEVIVALGTGNPDEAIVKYTLQSVTSGFNRLKKKTGIDMSFHDLRHYSASIMHYLGIPDVYIMAKHGWKTDTTMKMIYRNVLEDKQNQFVDRTNGYFVKTFLTEKIEP